MRTGPPGSSVAPSTVASPRPATYRAAFIDPTGSHLLEYGNNSANYAGANSISVAAAANTPSINAALAHP